MGTMKDIHLDLLEEKNEIYFSASTSVSYHKVANSLIELIEVLQAGEDVSGIIQVVEETIFNNLMDRDRLKQELRQFNIYLGTPRKEDSL